MTSQIDLRQLALQRDSSSTISSPQKQRRRWLSRYVLPAACLFGFIALLLAAAGQQLVPRTQVEVVPVVVKRSAVQQAGTPLFQAPGWIEPRPTATNVPALAAGIIEALFVVEGQYVELGEPIAQLIDVDAELALQRAEAVLEIRQGELDRAVAERDAAQIRYEHPVHLEADLAEAESKLATVKTELDNLPRRIERARAELKFAEQSLQGKRRAGGGISEVVVQRAEADYLAAQADLQELIEREPNLRQNVKALQRQASALQQQLQLLIEERRQLEEAKAKVTTAAANRDEARVALEKAKLELKRMVVKAPIQGRILSLIASPGDRVMGLDTTSEHRSTTVVRMYDPDRLQVRADVRLEDVPLVTPGQPVKVETASSPKSIRGRVLLPTSSANIQKNTLEVKVELLDPPETVTPEMLVTATFLAPESKSSQQQAEEAERLFVPRELLQTGERGEFVWVVSERQRAVQRNVQAGVRSDGGLVEVTAGLKLTDKLIATNPEDLRGGMRVEIVGENQRLGMSQNSRP